MWSDTDSWLSNMTPRSGADWTTLTAEDRTDADVPSPLVAVDALRLATF